MSKKCQKIDFSQEIKPCVTKNSKKHVNTKLKRNVQKNGKHISQEIRLFMKNNTKIFQEKCQKMSSKKSANGETNLGSALYVYLWLT